MSIQIKHKASHTQDNILTADEYNEAHDVVGVDPGRIVFGLPNNQLGEDDNLFWDNTNKRLGIGTTTPSQELHVEKGGIPNQPRIVLRTAVNDAAGARLELDKARGTSGSYSTVSSGDSLGSIRFRGFAGGDFRTAAWIEGVADGAPGSTFIPGAILFWITDSSGNQALRFRINSAGNVGISASPTNILTVQQNSATDPIADAWLQYSTKETKKIIREVNPRGYLEKFKTVKIYEWKRETQEQDKKQLPKFRQKHVSVVADDPTTPDEIVAKDADGNIQGIDLGAYIGFLHAVIKELIDKLRANGIEV